MFIDHSHLDEIRARIDIVDIIGAVVNLKPSGQNLKACCPFHKEKTPSFMVNPGRGSYRCFGCGESGDIFSFVMKYEGLTFPEAVERLAQRAGVQLTHTEPTEKRSQAAKVKDDLFQIHQIATQYYVEALQKPGSHHCLNYLVGRGVSKETYEKFQLGYAPMEWSALFDYLKNKGYSEKIIEDSGLITKTKKGNTIDRFRDRLMFPIFNVQGKVCGFSGRALKDTEMAKYLNSPETLIFKKSQLLYGLYQAQETLRVKKEAILAEGHLDVCLLHQAGYTQSLGVQGTAFTDEHGKLLKRWVANLSLLFDGDSAGIKAAIKMLPISFSMELPMKIALLPEGEDPASLIQQKKEALLEELLSSKVSLFQFKIDALQKEGELTPERKSVIVKDLCEDIRASKNPVLIDSLIQTLANRMDISSKAVRDWFEQKSRNSFFPVEKRKYDQGSEQNPVIKSYSLKGIERDLLCFLLQFPELHQKFFQTLSFDWIENKTFMNIIEQVFYLGCEKNYSFPKLIEILQGGAFSEEKLNELKKITLNGEPEEMMVSILKVLEVNFIKKKLISLKKQLATQVNIEPKLDLMKKVQQCQQRLLELDQK